MRALALLMAFSALTVTAVPLAAAAQCIPCEPVNNLCRRFLDFDCLAVEPDAAPVDADAPVAASAQPCAGGICDTINRVCGNCIPATEQERCMGEACDAINRVCDRLFGASCVG